MKQAKMLHDASQRGDMNDVEAQLRHGQCDVDATVPNGFGETPLFVACANKRCDVARLLINFGADVDHISEHGTTPLFAAVGTGDTELCLMIISQSVRIDAANHMGLTPLIRAARAGCRRSCTIGRRCLYHETYNARNDTSNCGCKWWLC
jgi:ankyrin repeat protein